ncbi:MAG: hypothetical protein LBO69_07720 [Ignavibacteria bacterium]|jgi:hypothetical protein|nr:hypothetical protein [Ignavibacteria bacterium]
MDTLESVKLQIFDHIRFSENEQFLIAINNLFEATTPALDPYHPTPAQIEMLEMSLDDYANGRVYTEEEMEALEEEWLK